MNSGAFRYLVLALLAIGALLLGGYYAYNHFTRTLEEKILASIERILQAGENKSVRGIMAEIAPEYRDEFNQNRKALAEKVRYWCTRNLQEDVKIEINAVRVQVSPDGLHAQVQLMLGGNRPVTEVLKLLRQNGLIELDYQNQDGNWLISEARAKQKNSVK